MTIDFSDPSYPAYPILAIIGLVLVLTPLPWHFQAWNAGTCLYMFWTATGCLITAVNAIVWRDDAIDRAPLWCDISTRLQVGITVGIPAASLCINRRLYKIATSNTVGTTRKDKRNALLIDAAIAFGIPFLQMILEIIVQGHRYDIYEGMGCQTTVVNTPLTYPLVFLWPTIIGLTSAIYCILTLRAFMKRRAEFAQFLSNHSPGSGTSSLTVNRYFRLMALATSELTFNLPISLWGLYLNINSNTIHPYTNWDDIHFDYNAIGAFPALLWRQNKMNIMALELGRWPLVLCALLFFAFFGFAEEARRCYKNSFWTVAQIFGRNPPAATSKIGSLPSFVKSSEKATSQETRGWKRLFSKKANEQSDGWRRMSGTLPSFTKTHSVVSSTVVSYSPYSPQNPKLAPYMTSSSSPSTPTTCKFSPTEETPRLPAYSMSQQSATASNTTFSYPHPGPPRHEMPTPSSLRTSFDQEYRPNSLLSVSPPPVPSLPVTAPHVDRGRLNLSTSINPPRHNERPYSIVSTASTAAATVASIDDQREERMWPTPIHSWVPRTPTSSRPTSATF